MIGCSTYGQEFVGVRWLSNRVQDLGARVWGLCGSLVIGCSTYGQEFVGVQGLSDRVQDLGERIGGCVVA